MMPAESHFAGIVFLCASFSIQQIRRHDLLLRSVCNFWIRQAEPRQCQKNQQAVFLLLRSACNLWIRQAAPRQCQKISKLFFAIALGLHYLCIKPVIV